MKQLGFMKAVGIIAALTALKYACYAESHIKDIVAVLGDLDDT